MGVIKGIKKNAIMESLQGLTRQYFVGNLKKPQNLSFFISEKLEIGITSYENYSIEEPHKHSEAFEYQYMVSGRTQYFDVDTREVHEFITGDFFEIEPNTSYAQKSKPGTVILFIKVPSINDKIVLPIDEELQKWLDVKLKTVRTDYFYNEQAPKANSIKPASAVAIVNDSKILMLKRSDNKKWTMPGGTLEFGESLIDCAVREVKEEAGLDVKITDIIGTYTDPNIVVSYSDGEVRQEFTVLYFGEYLGGKVSMDEESTEYQWININDVLSLELAASQRRRLNDVIAYIERREKHFG